VREQIASFESFLFSRDGKSLVLDWLGSHQPGELVRQIREFAANDFHVEKVRSVLTEVLNKAQENVRNKSRVRP
jgi:hypothetical protein